MDIVEVTNQNALRFIFMLSILPSLWFGHGNSQKQDPTFTKAQWDGFLRDNLFSGVDHVFRDFEGPVHGFSVIVS